MSNSNNSPHLFDSDEEEEENRHKASDEEVEEMVDGEEEELYDDEVEDEEDNEEEEEKTLANREDMTTQDMMRELIGTLNDQNIKVRDFFVIVRDHFLTLKTM